MVAYDGLKGESLFRKIRLSLPNTNWISEILIYSTISLFGFSSGCSILCGTRTKITLINSRIKCVQGGLNQIKSVKLSLISKAVSTYYNFKIAYWSKRPWTRSTFSNTNISILYTSMINLSSTITFHHLLYRGAT